MREMREQEWRAFVSEGTRTGKLATIDGQGRPHVTPVWFLLDDDGSLVFTTGSTRSKGKSVLRSPEVCMCIDDETPPFAYVMVRGKAIVTEDLDELRTWATRIGGRYMGADRAEEYGRRNAVPGELLVRVSPDRVVAKAGISD